MHIENPVLKKELLTILRTKKAYILLFVFVAGASIIALSAWPSRASGTLAVGAGASVGRNFFGYLSFGILILITILTPALSAGVFTEEKEKLTHDLLMMTLMKPRSILLAKLSSAIGSMGIMVFATLPVFAVGFLIGGINLPDLLWTVVIFACAILAYGLIGVNASLIARRTVNATLLSLGLVFGYCLLLPLGIFALISAIYWNQTSPPDLVAEIVFSIFSGPFIALAHVVSGMTILKTGPSGPLGFTLGTCVPLYLFARWRVKRPVGSVKTKSRCVIRDKAMLRRARRRFPFYLTDPFGRLKPIRDGVNPVTAREIRFSLPGRTDALIRVFYVSLTIFLLCGLLGVMQSGEAAIAVIVGFSFAFILIFVPGFSANIFSLDAAQGNEDALRTTLLDSRRIVMGKFYGSFLASLSIGLPAIASCIIYFFVDRERPTGALVMAIGTILISLLLANVVGVLSAVLTRKRVASVLLAYLFTILVFFGNVITMAILAALFGLSPDADDFLPFSPLTSFFWAHMDFLADEFQLWLYGILTFAAIFLALLLLSIRLYKRLRMQDR